MPRSRSNPYGYGLTRREFEALVWAMEREIATTGPYLLTGPNFGRYKGMARGTPYGKRVEGLLEKGMVYRDDDMETLAGFRRSEDQIFVYTFTSRAIFVLARNGGFKVPGQRRVWKCK